MNKIDLLFNGLILTTCSFIIACLSLFVIKCIEKWGVSEYWDIRIAGQKLLGYELPSYCVWCFSFWISLVYTVTLCAITGQWSLLSSVLISTPICFAMYK